MKRNFKNFNHWLAEVRQIAIDSKKCRDLNGKPMNKSQINWCFSKNTMQSHFDFNSSPKEAFEDEMQEWADNQDAPPTER